MARWILRRMWPKHGELLSLLLFVLTTCALSWYLASLTVCVLIRDVPLPMSSLLFIIFRGRDTIGYWRGMRSMKKAYAHGTAIYAILCFEKP